MIELIFDVFSCIFVFLPSTKTKDWLMSLRIFCPHLLNVIPMVKTLFFSSFLTFFDFFFQFFFVIVNILSVYLDTSWDLKPQGYSICLTPMFDWPVLGEYLGC